MPYVSIGVLEVKNPPASAGDVSDMGSILGSGRSSGGGYSNPLQYSCLENLMDRGAWWATIHRVTQSQTQLKWLSTAQQTTFYSFSLHHGEKAMATHSSTLAWIIPWTEEPGRLQSMGSQSRTRLSNFTFTFHFPALEKEMAIHSSVLAWRIPGMGEPGGLLSMGSHRLGQSRTQLKRQSCHLAVATAPWQSQFDHMGTRKIPCQMWRRNWSWKPDVYSGMRKKVVFSPSSLFLWL